MPPPSALIVGGGVAGLSAAWWLAQIGWQATIIERAPDLRADGYILGLSGPGYEVARRMGILPALKGHDRHINENVFLGRDGRELLRLRYHEFLRNLEWVTLSRTALLDVLHGAVRGRAEILYGTTLAAHEDRGGRVDVTLSSGEQRSVDLLIGADGVHSSLRRQLFGGGPVTVPFGYRVAAFQLPDTLGLGRDFLSYAEPGRLAEFYTLAEGRLATLYIWRSSDSGFVPPEQRRRVLRDAFASAHPDARRWIDLLPEGEPLFFDSMAMIDLPAWSKGRVLLLGDAAHCLTLVAGQGAGIAMTSACLLAEELAANPVERALANHERRLRPSVSALQERSRRMAAWFIPDTPFAFAVRNKMLRWMPRRILGWYLNRSVRSEILAASKGLELKPAATSSGP